MRFDSCFSVESDHFEKIELGTYFGKTAIPSCICGDADIALLVPCSGDINGAPKQKVYGRAPGKVNDRSSPFKLVLNDRPTVSEVG